MKELSIFIDESGDFGEYDHHSPYYIITMVSTASMKTFSSLFQSKTRSFHYLPGLLLLYNGDCFLYSVYRYLHLLFPQLGWGIDTVSFIRELRQKYILNSPEGMTAILVKNITDDNLLDMHYFLTEY